MTQPSTDPNDNASIAIHPDYWDAHARRLVAAIVTQAAIDARKDSDALDWLQTEGIAWLDAVGIDHGYVTDWLNRQST